MYKRDNSPAKKIKEERKVAVEFKRDSSQEEDKNLDSGGSSVDTAEKERRRKERAIRKFRSAFRKKILEKKLCAIIMPSLSTSPFSSCRDDDASCSVLIVFFATLVVAA